MAITREDIQESIRSREEKKTNLYFFDVSKSGAIAPKSMNDEGRVDVAILKNEQAVIESIYNILLTEPGERVMDPLFGCGLNQYQFEFVDTVTASHMTKTIAEAIIKYEKRIADLDVVVTPLPDKDTFQIDISIIVNTTNNEIVFTTTLDKVR